MCTKSGMHYRSPAQITQTASQGLYNINEVTNFTYAEKYYRLMLLAKDMMDTKKQKENITLPTLMLP